MNKIFILIPTHNRKQLLCECLYCIAKQTYKNIETVVIDDGSTDGTSAMIKKIFPKTTILMGDGKLWWGRAMRKGVDYVLKKSQSQDFVLLLNDDTTFDSYYLEKIINISRLYKRAIITSVCYSAKDRKTLIEAGVRIDWNISRIDVPLKVPNNYGQIKIRKIDAACGRGTLIPIKVIKKIGNISKMLPHYKADYEYLIRARNSGFNLYISYEAIVYSSTKPGGIKFIPQKTSLKDFLLQSFSRRSRSNIIDQLIFILKYSPPDKLIQNLFRFCKELLFRISFIEPFYKLKTIFKK